MHGDDPHFVTSVRCLVVALGLLGAVHVAKAQTVYRCELGGKVAYSHEPCLGAKAVDTTPTQGLDRSSGTSRKGADVRRSELDQRTGEALRPITGLSPEQRRAFHRRAKLSAAVQRECKTLDARLPEQEAAERAADPLKRHPAQVALFESRKRYRELGC